MFSMSYSCSARDTGVLLHGAVSYSTMRLVGLSLPHLLFGSGVVSSAGDLTPFFQVTSSRVHAAFPAHCVELTAVGGHFLCGFFKKVFGQMSESSCVLA